MRTGFVQSGTTALFYQEEGEGDPILFIHAGVADSRMWRDQMDLAGHRCVTFDHRGYGRTLWVPGPYANGTDALTVLDHGGVDTATVVGCSNGAEAALQLALIAPQRVSALVLVGVAARGWEPRMGWVEEPLEDQVIDAAKSGDHATAAVLEAQLWLAGPGRSLVDIDPEIVALFIEMDLIPLATEGERANHVVTLDPPTNDRLGEITCPSLVIVGKHLATL
ncbi:MAG: alpha/beta hydrolase [Actinobacteria bacterium]|nr:alpha/beta hydrolase [Actinomycetota bacterium]